MRRRLQRAIVGQVGDEVHGLVGNVLIGGQHDSPVDEPDQACRSPTQGGGADRRWSWCSAESPLVSALVSGPKAQSATEPGEVPPQAAAAVQLLMSARERTALTPEFNASLPTGRMFPTGTTFTVDKGSWHQAGAYANVSGTLRMPGCAREPAEVGLMHRNGRWLRPSSQGTPGRRGGSPGRGANGPAARRARIRCRGIWMPVRLASGPPGRRGPRGPDRQCPGPVRARHQFRPGVWGPTSPGSVSRQATAIPGVTAWTYSPWTG